MQGIPTRRRCSNRTYKGPQGPRLPSDPPQPFGRALFTNKQDIRTQEFAQTSANGRLDSGYAVIDTPPVCRYHWDMAMAGAMLYVSFVVPIQIPFGSTRPGPWLALDLALSMVFVCDIVVNLNTGEISAWSTAHVVG